MKFTVGLVGHAAAGKGTALETFKEAGAEGFTFSNTLKRMHAYLTDETSGSRFENLSGIQEMLASQFGEEQCPTIKQLQKAKEENKGIFALEGNLTSQDRFTLADIGNAVREQYNEDGILATAALKWVREQKNNNLYLLDGIRREREIEILNAAGVYIIGIRTPEKIRRNNMQRQGEVDIFKQEQEYDEIQKREGDEIEQCLRLCHLTLYNETLGDTGRFKQQLREVGEIVRIPIEGQRYYQHRGVERG